MCIKLITYDINGSLMMCFCFTQRVIVVPVKCHVSPNAGVFPRAKSATESGIAPEVTMNNPAQKIYATVRSILRVSL